MSLSHYDPLASLRAVESAFSRMLTEPQANRPWAPSVDIYETQNELVLKADVPDVDPAQIEVKVENQTLTIAGERKFESEATEKGYHRIERSYGHFVRSFAAALLGNALALVAGWAYLATIIGAEAALAAGVTPFILGAILKSGLHAALLKGVDTIRAPRS